jgi:hypothetical protein
VILRRLCLCACGVRVKGRKNRYASIHCIPHATRVAAGRKGRKNYAYRRRAEVFRADLERLPRQLTREDLLELLMRVYRRSYNSGFQAGQRTQDPELDLLRARDRGAA